MAKKIEVITEIKGYSKKKGKGLFGISIGTMKLTEAKRNLFDGLIDNAEKVKLTIEVLQEELPYKE